MWRAVTMMSYEATARYGSLLLVEEGLQAE